MSILFETNGLQQLLDSTVKGPASRHALFIVPALILVGLAAIFGALLNRNPEHVPSALIGKPVPSFTLPPVLGRTAGLSTEDLRGQPSLVNIFASWCTACRAEHPLFMKLKAEGIVSIHGINYKDRPDNAAKWLDDLGDPYNRTGADLNGRVSIDWGVYGVPETFVVSADGIILYKHIGPVTAEALNQIILALIRKKNRGEAIGSLPIQNER